MGFLCPQASLLRMAWELGKGGVPADCNFILSYLWRVSSKIAPNHPNHFRIILIRARPWIQDPRLPKALARAILDPMLSRIIRIILIRARPWIQDPRSKIAQGSCQGILDPTLTRWIQDSLARPLGNLGSWILDPGPGPNQNDSDDSAEHWIQDCPRNTSVQSWILDLGSGPESK